MEDAVMPGRTLGNLILIEDDVREEEPRREVNPRSLRPEVVMTLIKIED